MHSFLLSGGMSLDNCSVQSVGNCVQQAAFLTKTHYAMKLCKLSRPSGHKEHLLSPAFTVTLFKRTLS